MRLWLVKQSGGSLHAEGRAGCCLPPGPLPPTSKPTAKKREGLGTPVCVWGEFAEAKSGGGFKRRPQNGGVRGERVWGSPRGRGVGVTVRGSPRVRVWRNPQNHQKTPKKHRTEGTEPSKGGSSRQLPGPEGSGGPGGSAPGPGPRGPQWLAAESAPISAGSEPGPSAPPRSGRSPRPPPPPAPPCRRQRWPWVRADGAGGGGDTGRDRERGRGTLGAGFAELFGVGGSVGPRGWSHFGPPLPEAPRSPEGGLGPSRVQARSGEPPEHHPEAPAAEAALSIAPLPQFPQIFGCPPSPRYFPEPLLLASGSSAAPTASTAKEPAKCL